MAFRITPEANEDIAELYEYGALTYGFRQATDYVAGLEDALQFVSDGPYAVRERTEYDPPVRVYVYARHAIVYRIESEDAVILRVLGGQQDWQRYF